MRAYAADRGRVGQSTPPLSKASMRWISALKSQDDLTEECWIHFEIHIPKSTLIEHRASNTFASCSPPLTLLTFTGTEAKKAGNLAPWLSALALQHSTAESIYVFPHNHFFSTPRCAHGVALRVLAAE